MSRTDVLSEIKEAESKANAAIAQAEADKKAAVAQARRDSAKRLQDATDKARTQYENVIAEQQTALNQKKADRVAEGEKQADELGKSAKDKIKEVNDFLTKEFERAIDVIS